MGYIVVGLTALLVFLFGLLLTALPAHAESFMTSHDHPWATWIVAVLFFAIIIGIFRYAKDAYNATYYFLGAVSVITIVLLFATGAANAAPVCNTSAARAADKWTGDDKAMHLGGSAVIGMFASTMTSSEPKALAIAMVPGVLKEIQDRKTCGNFFSVKDLAADALGAYLGVKFGHTYIAPIGPNGKPGVTIITSIN